MMEIHPEHTRTEDRPSLILPALIWFFAIVAMIGTVVLVTGCAQTFTGVCALKVMGQDEHGNFVAKTYCEAS